MYLTPTERYQDFLRQQKHMGIMQLIRLRKQYIVGMPKWSRPLWGYICGIPLLLVVLFIPMLLERFIHPLLFPTVFLIPALALISFLWGIGPALLALVVSIIGLDVYFIPPVGQFTLFNWWDIAQLLPFFVSSLIIVLLTGQRERAYIHGHQDRQELHHYAEELEWKTGYLEAIKRERDSFLSIASHELKNPVTALRGYLQLLHRRLTKSSTSIEIKHLEEALQRMNEQTIRLTTLIDELLDVNTFHSHGIVLSKRPCELNQLCRKIIEDQRELTGREIIFFPCVEPLTFQMDVDRMAQVVLNLVSNALKYSSVHQSVEVCVRRNNQLALLQVQDHGCGIAPGELPHIFEMYYRAPCVRSSTISGLGLGLAISRDIIDRHGGRIWCESALAIGSTFFIELPIVE